MGAWMSRDRRRLARASIDAPRYERLAGKMLVRCVDVYDGDTFTVLMRHNGDVVRRRCRCLGYDAPEMRGPDKDLAIAARDHLASVIPKGVFKIQFEGTDKYGRLLVSFIVNGESLAQHMVRTGHGYPYDGGRKKDARRLQAGCVERRP